VNDWAQYKGVSGIYAIENTANGKVYIGQAQDVCKRLKEHLQKLKAGKHANAKLRSAWSKHGENCFRFFLLEPCRKCDLDALEQTYMDSLAAAAEGYNLSPTASSTRGYKHSAETRENMRAATTKFWTDPDIRARLCAVRKTQANSPEVRARMSDSAKKAQANPKMRERMESPEMKKRHSQATKAALSSPEMRQRMSETSVNYWSDLEARARRTAAIQAGLRASSKLTEKIVAEIRARYVRRCPVNGGKALAGEFGVSPQIVSMVLKRKIWA
jgi:group I intron endonuclease